MINARSPNTLPIRPRPRPRRLHLAVALVLISAFVPSHAASGSAQSIDFNRHVRPLLSDRCFACHGPDANARKAQLRLDTAEGAFKARDGLEGGVIVPGQAEESELFLRITAEEDFDRMPPPGSNLVLTEEEKALLRLWIDQGAVFESHWAFLPIGDRPVPQPVDGAGVENPIDAFVRARLEQQGRRLSPEASRESLIRRLNFDLTGLPPMLAAIDAFLADDAPDAYEKLVDRLLSSPAYGERRANEWLDLARYADTYGYQSDVERDLSPWRDWVIRSFNENLPYDDFLTWQLAGDLLPQRTREQILATAFNRLHRQTNEGGSIEEEFRAEYAADRVQTVSTAFLGLTMECARCHDHKFDPISQRDFYRMFAFFNNIDEYGLYSHFTRATPSPSLLLYPEGLEAEHEDLKNRIRSVEESRRAAEADAQGRFEEWRGSADSSIPTPAPDAAFSFDVVEENRTPDRVVTDRRADLVDGPMLVEGRRGMALRFSGDNSVVAKEAGDFNRTAPFSFSLWIEPTESQDRAVIFHRSRAWSDSGSRGYELVLESMRPTFALVHFWPGNAIQVRALDPVPIGAWSHLAITYDGSSRASGVRLYLDGRPLRTEVVRDRLFKDILHRESWGDADVGNVHLTLAGRFRDSGFKNGAIDEFLVFDRCLTAGEVRLLTSPDRSSADAADVFAYYVERVDEPCRALAAELRQLREAENRLVNDVPEIMVMEEMPDRRPTYVLRRGAYDAPADAVEPGMPSGVLPFDESLPPNRLGLARWMTDPRNPLTARVAVNRVWQTCFGQGLVATAEDFGSQGRLPTHPDLLDWLARNFIDSGWNVKALYKLITMSATYRQASSANAELIESDPENLGLARGPKHRLDAEAIRDNALAVSGLLSPRIGGPSVRPYQPAGVWEESGTGKTYVQDEGEKLYRRSLYTFWRRTAPPPNMLTFDATSREVCTAKREPTSTPLQALVLLNDPQFVEAARVLAEHLVRENPADANARIGMAFRLATGRQPQEREREILQQLYREQHALYLSQPALAERLLAVGDSPVDQRLSPAELAATTVLTSTVMNLDEFVMKR